MPKPTILRAAELPAENVAELAAHFHLLDLPDDPAGARAFLAAHGAGVRGLALRKTRVDADFLAALPALEIISSYSAGLDNLDVAAARARGIRIATTSQVLAGDVANLALGLALAVTRQIPQADAFLRAGEWRGGAEFQLTRSLGRMRVGVVGLGTIGLCLADRLVALGARVAYCGPRPKPVAHDYIPDVAGLAAACDMLVVACPLTPDTHHLIDAAVLARLGPEGYLVNISRGAVVDEAALVAALAQGGIAGAALDVFEREPEVPAALIADRRLVLTPHVGSATHDTRAAMADHVVDALIRHFGLAGPRG